jgi:hypothetical protein
VRFAFTSIVRMALDVDLTGKGGRMVCTSSNFIPLQQCRTRRRAPAGSPLPSATVSMAAAVGNSCLRARWGHLCRDIGHGW